MSSTRIRRTPDQWRTIFAEHAASGLTQQAFCESTSIPFSTFSRWRQRLSREDVLAVETAADAVTDFVELPRVDHAMHAGELAVRLELGNGMVLELRRSA